MSFPDANDGMAKMETIAAKRSLVTFQLRESRIAFIPWWAANLIALPFRLRLSPDFALPPSLVSAGRTLRMKQNVKFMPLFSQETDLEARNPLDMEVHASTIPAGLGIKNPLADLLFSAIPSADDLPGCHGIRVPYGRRSCSPCCTLHPPFCLISWGWFWSDSWNGEGPGA